MFVPKKEQPKGVGCAEKIDIMTGSTFCRMIDILTRRHYVVLSTWNSTVHMSFDNLDFDNFGIRQTNVAQIGT
jgi:hypothetical protein